MSSVAKLYGVKELPENSTSTLKVDWLLPKQNIGIEIEVEAGGGTTLSDDLSSWTRKGDGSLINGVEFVLTRPMCGDNLSSAVEEFFANNRTRSAPTSGTHIHMDMREKGTTLATVRVMAAIMGCIEPAVYSMFADGREYSGYTNPLDTMPSGALCPVFKEAADHSSDAEFINTYNPGTREYKYYGFNMLPLGRYGSVEFRYFNTATNAQELIEWIQFCMHVKQAAVSVGSLSSFKSILSDADGWRGFVQEYFAPWYDRMIHLLPHKAAARRYKQFRSRAAKGKTYTSVEMVLHKDPKFRKFFASRVLDKTTGKYKLVYDRDGIAAAAGVTLYVRGVTNSDLIRNGDIPEGTFYMERSYLYIYDDGWREVAYFNSGGNVPYEVYYSFTSAEMEALYRAADASHVYEGDPSEMTQAMRTTLLLAQEKLRNLSQYYSNVSAETSARLIRPGTYYSRNSAMRGTPSIFTPHNF